MNVILINKLKLITAVIYVIWDGKIQMNKNRITYKHVYILNCKYKTVNSVL